MENAIIIILFLLIILILIILGMYNKLVRLRNSVKQSKSGIDVCLKQRFDLIPNFLETVKGYVKHEEGLFTDIAKLRSSYDGSNDLKTGESLNKEVNHLIAIAESYPELKADGQFINLQNSLEKIEDKLQAARIVYNESVTNYNNKIETVPSNFVAALFGFKEEDLFDIDVSEKKNVKLDI